MEILDNMCVVIICLQSCHILFGPNDSHKKAIGYIFEFIEEMSPKGN